jgi:MFS family permease
LSLKTEYLRTAGVETDPFPEGVRHVLWFVLFNALSYQIILNTPMILYAKSLGASATVLGIIAGMTPLLVIFQIPAAKHVGRIGCKRFVFAGWGARTLFVVGMALVPLAGGFLNPASRLALLLANLFAFNLIRGISTCGWLPWISALIPASMRGRYLVRDVACQNLGGVAVFLLAAFVLGEQSEAWRFAVLFGFSAVMAWVSLGSLRRVPEVETPAEGRPSAVPVPWGEIIAYPPFQKLVWMAAGWSVAYGGLTTFVVAFLKTECGMSEYKIMLVTSVSFLGGMTSLVFLGSRLDRLGSKPVLIFSMASWLLIVGGWIVIAGRVVAPLIWAVLGLQFLMGLASSLVAMATTRLALEVVPPMGRDHFFTFYSVAANLTLGVAPVFWGAGIDALQNVHGKWLGMEWNRFSIFFTAVCLVFLLTLFLCRRLEEARAVRMEELLRDIVQQSPLRYWFRFWPRG